MRAGILDNLIDLTAEQLIQRHSPIIRKELSKFTTAKKIGLIQEALTQDMPESSNAIAEFFGELYSARSERNEIVHNTWRVTDTPEVKTLVKVKHKGPEEHVRSVTAKGMTTLADRLLDLAIELGDWKWPPTTRSSTDPHQPPVGNVHLASKRPAHIREGSRKMTMRPM